MCLEMLNSLLFYPKENLRNLFQFLRQIKSKQISIRNSLVPSDQVSPHEI